jgi:hypothetical protein
MSDHDDTDMEQLLHCHAQEWRRRELGRSDHTFQQHFQAALLRKRANDAPRTQRETLTRYVLPLAAAAAVVGAVTWAATTLTPTPGRNNAAVSPAPSPSSFTSEPHQPSTTAASTGTPPVTALPPGVQPNSPTCGQHIYEGSDLGLVLTEYTTTPTDWRRQVMMNTGSHAYTVAYLGVAYLDANGTVTSEAMYLTNTSTPQTIQPNTTTNLLDQVVAPMGQCADAHSTGEARWIAIVQFGDDTASFAVSGPVPWNS